MDSTRTLKLGLRNMINQWLNTSLEQTAVGTDELLERLRRVGIYPHTSIHRRESVETAAQHALERTRPSRSGCNPQGGRAVSRECWIDIPENKGRTMRGDGLSIRGYSPQSSAGKTGPGRRGKTQGFPRVAPVSQPWAEGLNPVGILGDGISTSFPSSLRSGIATEDGLCATVKLGLHFVQCMGPD